MPFKLWLYSEKKMTFWVPSDPVVAGEPSRMTSLCPAAVDSESLPVSVEPFLVLLAIEVALRLGLHLLFSSSIELCGNHSFWYWLLSYKCLVGTNRTWQCAPTLCMLYGEPSVSCLFSAKGRSNSYSSLATQVTGFGVLPKIRQAPQLAVYDE